MGYLIVIGVFGFPLGMIYVLSRSWAIEWYETDVFVEMYEAVKFLGQYSSEDEDSLFSLGKATDKVRDAIVTINNWGDSIERVRSKLAKKEFAEPLRNLEENLETQILPRIAQHKDVESMIRVLRRLAEVFSEADRPISLNEINIVNKQLENYEPIEIEETPAKLRIILSKEPIKFTGSFLLSFLIITIAILFHCKLFQTDLLDVISSLTNFLQILAVGIALGVGFYAVLRRKP